MENINESIKDYFEALNRLINNKPICVSGSYKINKDTVALEAGRKRGSIKKSREVFSDLIDAINAAENKIEAPKKEQINKLNNLKVDRDKYKELYEQALNRELMYMEHVNELEKEIKKYKERTMKYINNI
jgi:hypothetical protein